MSLPHACSSAYASSPPQATMAVCMTMIRRRFLLSMGHTTDGTYYSRDLEAVVEFIFHVYAEGVLYAEKDFNLPKHPEIDVPNLQVIKLMQSFRSKELVTERFAWRHYYWCALRGLLCATSICHRPHHPRQAYSAAQQMCHSLAQCLGR